MLRIVWNRFHFHLWMTLIATLIGSHMYVRLKSAHRTNKLFFTLPFRKVEQTSFTKFTWVNPINGPLYFSGAVSTFIGRGEALVCGGLRNRPPHEHVSDCFLDDGCSGGWRKGPKLLAPRPWCEGSNAWWQYMVDGRRWVAGNRHSETDDCILPHGIFFREIVLTCVTYCSFFIQVMVD